MKIGFCTRPLYTGHKYRGIGYYTKNLLENLKKSKEIEVTEFSDLNFPDNVDIVHYPWFDFFFRSLPIIKSKPTIVTVHDTIPLIYPAAFPAGLRGKINFLIQKYSLNSAAAIITDSFAAKGDIVKYLNINEQKIKVIHLAPADNFRILSASDKLRIKRKFHLPEQFLLYVGDVNYSKNVPFLIEGFSQIKKKDQFLDLKLVLVGQAFLKEVEGIDHPELRSLKKVNELIKEFHLSNEIIKIGSLETEDLVGFYNLATVYIQPSLYEGFGLPVLEAFKSSCPVICSNLSSLPEITSEAAVMFSPRNLAEFVKLVTDVLLDRSFRDKLSKLGLAQVEKFSWQKTTRETINVYSEILKKS